MVGAGGVAQSPVLIGGGGGAQLQPAQPHPPADGEHKMADAAPAEAQGVGAPISASALGSAMDDSHLSGSYSAQQQPQRTASSEMLAPAHAVTVRMAVKKFANVLALKALDMSGAVGCQ